MSLGEDRSTDDVAEKEREAAAAGPDAPEEALAAETFTEEALAAEAPLAETPGAEALPEEPRAETALAGEAPAQVFPTDEEDPTRGPTARIAFVVALTLGLVGFVTGLSQDKPGRVQARTIATPTGPLVVPTAPRYAELPGASLGPNAEWRNDLDKLPKATHDLFASIPAPDEAAKRAGLSARASRRAYAGAPPVIPHQVAARSAESCLVCHEQGQRVGDRVASPMPHAFYVNCLQCHGPPPPPALSASESGVPPSSFRGQAEPLRGERAGVGSPPVIPHATRMRENCLACHGPQGSTPAIRTTHAWRVNCRQCHAAATAGYAK